MNKTLLALTFGSLGLFAGTMIPHSSAQTFSWPRQVEYRCVEGIPGRNNVENFMGVLNSTGQEGWRLVGSPVGLCPMLFERGH